MEGLGAFPTMLRSDAMEVTANGYAGGRLPYDIALFDDYPQRDYKRVASPARSEGGHRAVTLDEMRIKLSRMKKELEVERARNRQYISEREQSSRHLKTMYEREWSRKMESLEKKLKSDMEKKVSTIKEGLSKEKDLELRQVLRYKDEEVKNMQTHFAQEKEDAVRVALELQKISLSQENSVSCDPDEDLVESLKSELESVKSTNKELEKKYKQKCASDSVKDAEIKRLHEEHDLDLSRVMQESKIAVLRDLHEMKIKEKLLQKMESVSSEVQPVERRVKSETSQGKSSEKVLTRQERANIESALLHSKSQSTNHTFTIEDSSDTESAKRPNSSKVSGQ